MKAIELVRWALAMTDKVIARLTEDMKDAPLTAPTPNGGNHPLWVMGHLAVSEGQLQSLITGKPNPVKEWAPEFRLSHSIRVQCNVGPALNPLCYVPIGFAVSQEINAHE